METTGPIRADLKSLVWDGGVGVKQGWRQNKHGRAGPGAEHSRSGCWEGLVLGVGLGQGDKLGTGEIREPGWVVSRTVSISEVKSKASMT